MSEDNLEPLVTQCPNCNTRFRVTESQLQIAAGRVRCGACLAVFEGVEHLSVDGETLNDLADSVDVDAMLSELDELSAREPENAPTMPVIGGAEFVAVTQATLAQQAGDAEPPEDLLALEAELLNELKAANEEFDALDEQNAASGDPLAESAEAANEEAEDDTLSAAPEATVATLSEVLPPDLSDWAEEVAADSWAASVAVDAQAEESTSADEDEQVLVEAIAAEFDSEQEAGDAQDGDSEDESEEQDEGVIELEAIDPAPVDVYEQDTVAAKLTLSSDYEPEFEPEDRSSRGSWLIMLLVLVALIGLPLQILYFKYDAWVNTPTYRPIYEYICQVAECRLPVMRDIQKIVSKKSIIRAHPEREDARIVDVLLVNTADFAQPYPLIELMATDLQGALVAGRRFRPEEYLKGDVTAAELMPPQTPIHVSLEIQDPSEDALSFEVKFR